MIPKFIGRCHGCDNCLSIKVTLAHGSKKDGLLGLRLPM